MRWTIFCLAAWLLCHGFARAQETVSMRLASGFGLPVGIENGKRYYKARGFRANGHLGEDWNGIGGGNTDLGDPVHCIGDGLVVYAKDFRAGWGNVVIVRHGYMDRNGVRFIDSLYGHLDRILVREGQRLERGTTLGTIGTAHGRYPAHLHFEIRKNIQVGMFRSMFPRDFSTYFDPTQFILTHQTLGGGGRMADMPVNTFPNQTNARVASRTQAQPSRTSRGIRWSVSNPGAVVSSTSKSTSSSKRKGNWKVDRFGDLREKR